MRMRVLAAGLAAAALFGGLAMAQTIRAPAGQAQVQSPNLTVAPASAADMAALQQRVTLLETRLDAAATQLAQTRLKLNALKAAVRIYAQCERELVIYSQNTVVAGTNTVPNCSLQAGQSLEATNSARLANALQSMSD